MKLAFTGTHGIGKTTLAKWLSNHLGIPYVPEFAREALEAGQKTDTLLDFVGFEHKILQLKLEEEKRLEEEGLHHFVADRSYLDYMCYLKYGMAGHDWREVLAAKFEGKDLRSYFAEYEKICRRENVKYDLIVFVLPFTTEISPEDDKRDKNPFSMQVIEDLLLREYSNGFANRVFIMQERDLERRKEFLLELLDRKGF